MLYILFAVLLVPIALLEQVANKKSMPLLTLLFFSVYLFLFCFSYKVGVDWFLYKELYEAPAYSGMNVEPGFYFVFDVLSSVRVNYWVVSAVIKFVFILTLYYFVKKYSPHPLFSIVLCVLSSPLLFNDLLRQQLAASILFFSIARWGMNGLFFFVSIFLAMLFHVSAIFFAPMFFLVKYRMMQHALCMFTLFVFLASLFGLSGVDFLVFFASHFIQGTDIYAKLLGYTQTGGVQIGAGYFIRFLVFSGFYFFYVRRPPSEALSICFAALSLATVYEILFYESPTLWTRLREYFIFSLAIAPLIIARSKTFALLMKAFVVAWSLNAFYNFYSNNYLYAHYEGYANYILNEFLDVNFYDSKRDLEVSMYWANWRPWGSE